MALSSLGGVSVRTRLGRWARRGSAGVAAAALAAPAQAGNRTVNAAGFAATASNPNRDATIHINHQIYLSSLNGGGRLTAPPGNYVSVHGCMPPRPPETRASRL